MEKVTDLRKLLVKQMQKLYAAEKQQEKAFAYFAEKVSDNELKSLINSQIDVIRKQINRLDKAFDILEVTENNAEAGVMKHLLDETSELLNGSERQDVADAAEVMALQQVKHYEIAAYGSICAYAKALGEQEVASLLHQNLEEEKDIDRQLTTLAKQRINKKAKTP